MKHVMRYSVLFLTVFVFCQVFTACSDDDDNGPAFSKDGKRLVQSFSYDWWEAKGKKGTYYFSYDGEGRMTRIEVHTTYKDEEVDRNDTGTEIYTYVVSGNRLSAKYVYTGNEYPEDNEYEEGVFLLNANGFVSSGEITDDNKNDVYSYECLYNEEGQLIQTKCPGHSGTVNYIWEEDNYVKIDGYVYSYYDTENKSNIDFGSILGDSEGLGDDDWFLLIAGFLGKGSKNLPKEADHSHFAYEFDSGGYVTEITETTGNERYFYTLTYN